MCTSPFSSHQLYTESSNVPARPTSERDRTPLVHTQHGGRPTRVTSCTQHVADAICSTSLRKCTLERNALFQTPHAKVLTTNRRREQRGGAPDPAIWLGECAGPWPNWKLLPTAIPKFRLQLEELAFVRVYTLVALARSHPERFLLNLNCSADGQILGATSLPTFGRTKTLFSREISTSALAKIDGVGLTPGATNHWRNHIVMRDRSKSTRAPDWSEHRHWNPKSSRQYFGGFGLDVLSHSRATLARDNFHPRISPHLPCALIVLQLVRTS